MAGRPGPPSRILVRTPAVADRVRAALGSRRVTVATADALPNVDEVVATLSGALDDGPPTLGIDGDEAAWNAALTQFVQLAPWERADDRHLFTFRSEDPRLATAVAVVMGMLGEVYGVALYPSMDELDASLQNTRPTTATCVQVVHPNEVPPPLAEGARHSGLALPDGRVPMVFGVDAGAHHTLDRADQRVALAAVQGVVALCARHPDFATHRREVIAPTVLGRVVVTTSPVAEPEALPDLIAAGVQADVAYAQIEGRYEDRPPERLLAVTLTLDKAHARRLADRLGQAEHVQITPSGAGRVQMVLHDGDAPLGKLFETPLPPIEQLRVVGVTDVVLRVCARRKRGEPEALAAARLANRAPGERVRHAPVFDGPMEAWPKASEVLLRYVTEAGVTAADLRHPDAQKLLDVASTVWSAVVLADFLGDTRHLDEVRRLPMWSHLAPFVRVKRQMFPTDPRMFARIEVGRKDGEPHFWVEASVPSGYTLKPSR